MYAATLFENNFMLFHDDELHVYVGLGKFYISCRNLSKNIQNYVHRYELTACGFPNDLSF